MNTQQIIMNIQAKVPSSLDKAASAVEAYNMGHRDAKAAAVEIAYGVDAVIAEARQIIIELCQTYGNPLPEATLAKMSPR